MEKIGVLIINVFIMMIVYSEYITTTISTVVLCVNSIQ